MSILSPVLPNGKPRQRRFNPKARTGCKTCRERRVKCGEEKPNCQRCILAGRVCGGYETIRMAKAMPSKNGSLTLQWVQPSAQPPETDLREQVAFQHFRVHVLESLAGPFDPCVWHRQVLCISMTEPAVRNAVIALGALGRSKESGESDQFALKHYIRAMRLLQERIPMDGPTSQYLVLVTCLLFVAFKFQHRGWMEAKQHLDSGLNIIRELQGRSRDASQALSSPSLVEAFERLDIQMSLFTGGLVHLTQTVTDRGTEHSTDDLEFRDVRDALRHLSYHLAAMRDLVHHVDEARFGDSGVISGAHIDFENRLIRQLASLKRWEEAMNELLSRISRPRDLHSAHILLTHYICCKVMVATCLNDGREESWDSYIPDFDRLVAFAEDVITKEEQHSPLIAAVTATWPRNSFNLDMGIIPPLYFTAMKCRDPVLRRRAIELLRGCYHQEGPWDGQTMVGLAEAVVRVEERAILEPRLASDIPEQHRLYRAWYDLREASPVLYCKRRRFESDGAWVDYVEQLD